MTAGRWTGGCVCGGLRYSATGAPELQGLCHCRNCQRLTGSGHVGFICFADEAVTVTGKAESFALKGGSGHPAMRYYCTACRSVVFGRSEIMPGRTNLYAGSLDEPALFKPTMAIFVRSRPPWDGSSRGLACFETIPG